MSMRRPSPAIMTYLFPDACPQCPDCGKEMDVCRGRYACFECLTDFEQDAMDARLNELMELDFEPAPYYGEGF